MKRLLCAAVAAAGLAVALLLPALAQQDAPRLTGPDPLPSSTPAPSLSTPVTDAGRRMRNYPEQPPVIPHDIEGYQLTVGTNTCLTCHRRQYVEQSGAPMISVTHYQDRDGQMLAEVSPRRYFCTQCHVTQSGVKPLVENTFKDMLELSAGAK